MTDEGRLVAGRYRLTDRIGAGAMGAVWQAHDELLGRTVAVKQLLLQPGLSPEERQDAQTRCMREGRIAARLHHPNAITVFDVVTDDHGQPCLIMEYLPSISLAQVLNEPRTLDPAEAASIGAQVAAALIDAHAVGIVHRDIKPGNVLLGDNGTVKITDFGISRATDDVQVTKTGMIAGTPAYLAPEVAIGTNPGPESDVFSLGSTIYAAVEGEPPFGLSENTLGLLHAVAAGQIKPPQRSGPLTSVLARLLDPRPEHRPTAQEAAELMAAVARGETPLGMPADNPSATRLAPMAGVLPYDSDSAGQGDGHHDGHTRTDYPAYDEDPYGDERTKAVPATAAMGQPTDPDAPGEQPARKGRWRKPLLVGGLVLVALAAGGAFIFANSGSPDQTTPGNRPAPVNDSKQTTSVPPETTAPPETTEEAPAPPPQPEEDTSDDDYEQPQPDQGDDPTTPPPSPPQQEPSTPTEPTDEPTPSQGETSSVGFP